MGEPAFPRKTKGTEGQGGRPAAEACEVEPPQKASYWNDDLRARWLGPLNLGTAFVDGHRT